MTEDPLTDQEVATLPLVERLMVALADAGFDESDVDAALGAIVPVLNEDLRLADPPPPSQVVQCDGSCHATGNENCPKCFGPGETAAMCDECLSEARTCAEGPING